MQNLQKISRCLISVSNKDGIVELARFLQDRNVEIISTGGTKKLLLDNKIKAKDISEFTNFPEIMDGRLKTLHPKVHGGLLAVLDNKNHQEQALQNEIESIDLLIVNLYPFVETLARTKNEDEIIENIDIGGPAMVRSAAKNFAYKTVITSNSQYQELMAQIEQNQCFVEYDFRKKMAAQAFLNIAKYDIAIAKYFNEDELFLSASLKQNLRYGENSHQKAAIYSKKNGGIVEALQIQGKELSYNNFNDADAAYNLAMEFEKNICVIVKHTNPCGVAFGDNLLQSYKNALKCDEKSAFGGIVALNGEIDEELADEISKIFFEVIIAKSINSKAKEILASKKNLRILIADFKKSQETQIKSISGGFLLQDEDSKNITKNDLKQAGQYFVDENEKEQLVFAMKICKHAKSNAIVIAKNFQAIGVGCGQTSRVDACEAACKKALSFENGEKIENGFLASDAFFPFADNIEIAAKYGIKAVIAPAGSIRDNEVVAAANKHKIAIYFIETRHFKH
jgi:phosphoribosylaminoimidazolecarboxamide formyltransferase / IMP cyclohydrolase